MSRKFFNYSLCFLRVGVGSVNGSPTFALRSRSDVVAVTLQIAIFLRGWANMSLQYKLMQRLIGMDKSDSRSSGGGNRREKVNGILAWRLLSFGVST